MLAYTADTWTQVIVAISIFVPVVVTIVIAIVFLRGAKNDPDEQRLKRAQREYEAKRES
jgi:mannitol-specific phosphotransferase system IIBC component